ncbi:histidine kinase [Pseudonocardia sp. ICBG1293]|uniref:sensor histidine kinase n=1 Tax=Pseudonocardia sp. ICBG1293 TaxID=2844382 RepID=UPI001CCE57DB|nr:histidine kinase [Pseudonocardia sp. ICBG1293]
MNRQDLTLVTGSLAIGAVLYPLMVVPALGGRVEGPLAVELVATFLGLCVAQLFRRQAPVPALAVGTVLLLMDVVPGPSIPAWIVYADLLYAATLHGPQRLSRHMVPLATVLAALLMITLVALDPAWQDGLVTAVGAIPLVLIPVAWGRNVRHHQETASAERRFAEQAAHIADLDRASAVHAERNRIARDLHDVVAGHVASIALQAEAAVTSAAVHDPAVSDLVGRMREESVRALREMRSMIDVLRADGSGWPRTARRASSPTCRSWSTRHAAAGCGSSCARCPRRRSSPGRSS